MNATSLYRISHWLYTHKIPLLPKLFRNIIFLMFNSYIPPSAQIGNGTVFAYGAIGVVLHANCKIGENCVIGQGVTVGAKEGFFSKDIHRSPEIGNNCYIAAGAKILGGIVVGNNCIIGAGSIVVANIPDNSVVVGSPGKVIHKTKADYLAIRC